jgi:hypothetical protein
VQNIAVLSMIQASAFSMVTPSSEIAVSRLLIPLQVWKKIPAGGLQTPSFACPPRCLPREHYRNLKARCSVGCARPAEAEPGAARKQESASIRSCQLRLGTHARKGGN